MSAVWVPASSIAFSSSGEKMTYWSFANSYPFTISSRATGISSFTHRYCCFRREPQPLCSRLKEMALLASVAEKSFTGMETSPKEIVNDAMERAAMSRTPRKLQEIPILDHEDIVCHSRRFEG